MTSPTAPVPATKSSPQHRDVQLLTAHDVAAQLSISQRSVWRAVSAGDLPKPIRLRGSARWLASEIEATIQRAAARRK